MRLVRLPPLPPLPLAIQIAGVELTFVRAWRADGSVCGYADLADDHPHAAGAAMQVLMMPRHYATIPEDEQLVLEGGARPPVAVSHPVGLQPVTVSSPVAAPTAPAWVLVSDPTVSFVREAAARQGWVEGDLVGTALGDDPGAGRSPSSGLTLAEMALTSRPPTWNPAEAYPWEVEGWRPPGIGFVPPRAPRKVAPVVEVQAAVVIPDDPEDPRLDAGPSTGEFVSGEQIAVVDAVAPPKVSPLVGWGTDEQIAQARAVLRQVAVEAGTPPSVSKATFHLKRLALPKVNAAQLAALIA